MSGSGKRKIAFIGAPGSGKSTLAREYAGYTGDIAIDTDALFVERYGDIAAFFARYGEANFRAKEKQLVLGAASDGANVLSCGGGVVLDGEIMNALRMDYDIVRLTAPIEVLKSRISHSGRPLENELERILEMRTPLYERYADYTVDGANGQTLDRLLAEIAAPRKNRYDILLCDADNTLLDFTAAMRCAMLAAARSLGLKSTDERIIDAFKQVMPIVWGALERGEITHGELGGLRFAMLSERLGERFDALEMNAAYVAEIKKTRFVMNGAIGFLDEVRGRGIKVYIVTNAFTDIAIERLRAIDGHIDGFYISEAIGYNKPDRRFFDAVLSDIGYADRRRILVLGDSLDSDIRGGKNSGIDTCHLVNSPTQRSIADYTVCSYAQVLKII